MHSVSWTQPAPVTKAQCLAWPFRSQAGECYAVSRDSQVSIARLLQASVANSSWTAEHVRQLFLAWAPPARVYPPCDTADLSALPLERKLKRLYLVSLAQVQTALQHENTFSCIQQHCSRQGLSGIADRLACWCQWCLPPSAHLQC